MQFSIFLTVLLGVILLTGCSVKPVVNSDQFQPIILEGGELTTESEKVLFEAETQFDKAVNSNLEFFSPASMEEATNLLYIARDYELKGLQDDSLVAAKKTLNQLKIANNNKAKVDNTLQPLLQQIQVLEELNCPLVLPLKYNKSLAVIKDLIREIETDGNIIQDDVIEKSLKDLQQLELETLLAIHWLPAKNTLAKAKAERANINAPVSYTVAKERVAQAKIDISNNIKDRELVASSGTNALRTAQHVLYLARDAELLDQLSKKQAESVALQIEELLQKIVLALKIQDVRHMSLLDQANAIAQAAETQASRLMAPLQAKIAELEKQRTLIQPAPPSNSKTTPKNKQEN
jgi:hypothetical protein